MLNAQNQVLLAQNYDPFGNVIKQVGTGQSGFGYTGEQVDPTGLVFLRARYYDPMTGRFITTDPFPGFGGLSQTQNPYVYGLNNPIRYTDPSGEFAETPWDLLMVGFDLVMLGVDTYQINFGNSCDRDAWELQRNLDYAALGMDLTALFVPFLPGGTGAAGSAAVRLGLKVPVGARAVQAVTKGAQVGGNVALFAKSNSSNSGGGKNSYKIYVVRDAKTNEVIYVGKTRRNLTARQHEHRQLFGREKWVLQEVESGLDYLEARYWEQKLIDQYGGIENLENKIRAVAKSKWTTIKAMFE